MICTLGATIPSVNTGGGCDDVATKVFPIVAVCRDQNNALILTHFSSYAPTCCNHLFVLLCARILQRAFCWVRLLCLLVTERLLLARCPVACSHNRCQALSSLLPDAEALGLGVVPDLNFELRLGRLGTPRRNEV
jgi:hypothetical protein